MSRDGDSDFCSKADPQLLRNENENMLCFGWSLTKPKWRVPMPGSAGSSALWERSRGRTSVGQARLRGSTRPCQTRDGRVEVAPPQSRCSMEIAVPGPLRLPRSPGALLSGPERERPGHGRAWLLEDVAERGWFCACGPGARVPASPRACEMQGRGATRPMWPEAAFCQHLQVDGLWLQRDRAGTTPTNLLRERRKLTRRRSLWR